MSSSPRFLLINPWIHDFAAFNLWSRPLGLLYLYSFLRSKNVHADYIDALYLDPESHAEYNIPFPRTWPYSKGKFLEEKIQKPDACTMIPRHYRRFGMSPDIFKRKLSVLSAPDCIFVTSVMTYWYPGVQETISVLKEYFPGVPIILGGNYATLCSAHAREYSGADKVIAGPWEKGLAGIFKKEYGIVIDPDECSLDRLPFPAHDLYKGSSYAVMRFSHGCPFNCDYCASSILSGEYIPRNPDRIIEEVMWNTDQGRKDIALYDDALLINADTLIIPVLKALIDRNIDCRFHTPNGMHPRYITPEIAELMFRSGFKTVRLSFESLSGTVKHASKGKVEPRHLEHALDCLHSAGYQEGSVDVYILMGIPGQKDEDVIASAEFIHSLGAHVLTAQYSPVPGTKLFLRDGELIANLENEPLLQNSTIASGWGFDTVRYDRIKHHVQELNHKIKEK